MYLSIFLFILFFIPSCCSRACLCFYFIFLFRGLLYLLGSFWLPRSASDGWTQVVFPCQPLKQVDWWAPPPLDLTLTFHGTSTDDKFFKFSFIWECFDFPFIPGGGGMSPNVRFLVDSSFSLKNVSCFLLSSVTSDNLTIVWTFFL